MKYLIFFFILLNSTSFISAQRASPLKNIFYLEAGVSFGNYTGRKFALNYVYRQKYSIQIGFNYLYRRAVNLPTDFEEVGFYDGFPSETQGTHEILIGKMVVLDAKRNIRMNLKIGIGKSRIEGPDSFRIELSYTPNKYTFHVGYKSVNAFIVDSALEWPLSKLFGVYIGSFLAVNKIEFTGGIRLGIMLGLIK